MSSHAASTLEATAPHTNDDSSRFGTVMSEARAEWFKAIELTEFACALPQLATGEVREVSRGVEFSTRTRTVTSKWNRDAGTNWMS